jgi:peroxiredoxin
VLGGLVLCLFAVPARAEGTNLTGRPAPEISSHAGLSGWTPGTTLASLRGQPVVLKFFFVACPACRRSMPEFEALHRAYAGRGVRFVALAFDERAKVESYWRQSGFTAPVAIDTAGVTPQRYGVVSYPTTYVIGADGRVASYERLSASVLEAALQGAAPALPAVSSLVAPRAPSTAGSPAAPSAIATAPTTVPTTAVTTAPATVLRAPSSPTTAPARAANRSEGIAFGSISSGSDLTSRNVAELGALPPVLMGAVWAASENDYGRVLKIAEEHLDATLESEEVVTAAKRLRTVALARHDRRLGRIETRWNRGDPRGAYLALLDMTADFHGTSAERALAERANAAYAILLQATVSSTR